MAESVLENSIKREPSRTFVPYWAGPMIGAMLYPGLLALFSRAIDAYQERGGSIMAVIFATFLMALAMTIPILAIRSLVITGHSDDPKMPAVRRMLLVVFAVFPLYAFLSALTGVLDLREWQNHIWFVVLLVVTVILYFYEAGNPEKAMRVTVRPWLRALHGSVALLLLGGFFVLHFTNHLAALWSIEFNVELVELFRKWYRSDLVEPVLLTALGIMIVTGSYMVFQYTRASADIFGALQTATGTYLAIFLCAHLTAVLSARQAGTETDWYFAVGETGHVLDYPAFLTPYYIFGVFFLLVHASLGFRMVLLSHDVSSHTSNRVFFSLTSAAAALTILIAAAMFDVHISID